MTKKRAHDHNKERNFLLQSYFTPQDRNIEIVEKTLRYFSKFLIAYLLTREVNASNKISFIMFKFRFIENKKHCSKTNIYVILGQKATWCDEGKLIYLDAPVLLLRIQDNFAETDDFNIAANAKLNRLPFKSNREIWGEIVRTNQNRFDKITLYRINGVNLVPVYSWQTF